MWNLSKLVYQEGVGEFSLINLFLLSMFQKSLSIETFNKSLFFLTWNGLSIPNTKVETTSGALANWRAAAAIGILNSLQIFCISKYLDLISAVKGAYS